MLNVDLPVICENNVRTQKWFFSGSCPERRVSRDYMRWGPVQYWLQPLEPSSLMETFGRDHSPGHITEVIVRVLIVLTLGTCLHIVPSLWFDLTVSFWPWDIFPICSYRWHIWVNLKEWFSKLFLLSLTQNYTALALQKQGVLWDAHKTKPNHTKAQNQPTKPNKTTKNKNKEEGKKTPQQHTAQYAIHWRAKANACIISWRSEISMASYCFSADVRTHPWSLENLSGSTKIPESLVTYHNFSPSKQDWILFHEKDSTALLIESQKKLKFSEEWRNEIQIFRGMKK